MSTAAKVWVAIAVLVAGVVFWAGRQSRPAAAETNPQLFAARAAVLRADSARVRDSLALVAEKANAASLTRAAARALLTAKHADSATVAYRDSVKVLSDSLVRVVNAAGQVQEVPVPPELVARLRADSATITAQAVAIDTLQKANAAEHAARLGAEHLAASTALELSRVKFAQPLEVAAAYAHGRRVGREQVFGLAVSGGILYGVITLAGVFR